ncbi:MAG: hypothetical protein JJE22_19105 [Bacteroidia bacterium]|nr:hypothetical protein [Bacteroidia bacterium]
MKKNLKKVFYQNTIQKKITLLFNQHPYFDHILVLRPDLILEHLPQIRKHGRNNIAYFWDSFARIPLGKETIPYFDKFFTFEQRDAKDFNLSFLPNFYYPNTSIDSTIKPEFDLTFLASFDQRFETLLEIVKSLQPLNLKSEILILAPSGIPAKYQNETTIHWISEPLSNKKALEKMRTSIVILDIAQAGQEGLSFRIFEALSLQKKIITTNQTVIDYDFYNPKNIFVWQNRNLRPIVDFFITPYSNPPEEIIKKYSLESWIRHLFNEKDLH